MKQNQIVVAILIGSIKAQTTSDLTVDNTLAGCNTYASQFDNTCTAVAASAADIPTATVTCTDVGYCPSFSGSSGSGTGTCTFTRKLCVTCRESGGHVYIRTQGNNIPSHCYE